MTYNDYIQNPMGKKNAVFSQREMFRAMYAEKLDKILVRENGKIEYKQFVDKKNDKYYVYIKIPSEVIAKFYYDVVIEFSTNNPVLKGIKSLENYDVRFYSNDPAFVFTFAHAFIVNDLFIKELSPKMSKLAIKKEAVEKNPKNEVGYVKSLFFAYLYIKPRGLFNKVSYVGASDINFKSLLAVIMSADKKIQLRQDAQKEYEKSLHIEKKLSQNKDKSTREVETDVQHKDSVSASPIGKRVNKVKTVKSIKSSIAAKKVKKKH